MGLSCTCYDWDDEPGSWAYYSPTDFSIFSKSKRKRCCSCKELINKGAECLEFGRVRRPYNNIEERISGDEIGIASWFMCEKCGEPFLNLTSAGYCIPLGENMYELLKEYHEITGFISNTHD